MTECLRAVIAAAHRMVCAMRGHDTLLQIEPHRLSLRCVSCGHETRGWTLDDATVPDVYVASPPRARQRMEASHV